MIGLKKVAISLWMSLCGFTIVLQQLVPVSLELYLLYCLGYTVIDNLRLLKLMHLFGLLQARQCLVMRGIFPMLADPRHPVSNVSNIFCRFT